jgi:PhzF family phenazine biosynthesis protein
MKRRYATLDVFTPEPLKGNPLACVVDGDGLSDAQMQELTRWFNLSETSFLLPPTDPAADYRVRIFTPGGELPFAGHPTLGSCAAWLLHGGQAKTAGRVVQECGIGLVTLKRDGKRLAFAAPLLRRSGPVTGPEREQAIASLGAEPLALEWVDNGPGWMAARFTTAAEVLALRPDFARMQGLKIGAVGAQAPGADTDFEVRAFVPSLGIPEDPVTGSLQAGLARWLIGAGLAPARYVAAQGQVLGRAGRVQVEQEGDTIWIGGDVLPLVQGTLSL